MCVCLYVVYEGILNADFTWFQSLVLVLKTGGPLTSLPFLLPSSVATISIMYYSAIIARYLCFSLPQAIRLSLIER